MWEVFGLQRRNFQPLPLARAEEFHMPLAASSPDSAGAYHVAAAGTLLCRGYLEIRPDYLRYHERHPWCSCRFTPPPTAVSGGSHRPLAAVDKGARWVPLGDCRRGNDYESGYQDSCRFRGVGQRNGRGPAVQASDSTETSSRDAGLPSTCVAQDIRITAQPPRSAWA